MSFGTRIILLYLVVAYLIPAFGQFILGVESAIYRAPELSVVQLVYGALIFLVVIGAAWDQSKRWRFRIEAVRPPHFALQLIVLLLVLGVSAFGFVEGMGRWRYSNTGLSENLSLTTLSYVLAPTLLEFMLVLEMFFFADDFQKRTQRRIVRLLIALGLILTASGIGPALLGTLALLYAFFPDQFRVLMFKDFTPLAGHAVATKVGIIPLAAIGFFALIAAIIIGDMIKTGADTETVTSYWGNLTLVEYLAYILERFSTAFISLRAALADYTTLSWADTSGNLWAPIGNFLYRLDSLTGSTLGIQRPYGGSIMRLNYELINIYALNAREGTSPGLIGGFLMSFPVPLALIALVAYIVLTRSILNNLSCSFVGPLTPIGVTVALYFLFTIFASPIDYLLIFDNGFLVLAAYASLALIVRSKIRKQLRHG